jgi:hypothetical protein
MTASARRQAVRRSRTSPRACRSQTGCRSQAGGRGRRPARPGCLSLADKTRTRRRHARLGGGVRRQAAGAAARSAAGSDAGTGVRARSAVLSSEPRSVGANTACPASRREAVTASQHQPSANPRGPKRTAPQAPSPRATASSPRGRARRCLERKAQIIVRIHTEQSAGGLTRQRSASAGSGTRGGAAVASPSIQPAIIEDQPSLFVSAIGQWPFPTRGHSSRNLKVAAAPRDLSQSAVAPSAAQERSASPLLVAGSTGSSRARAPSCGRTGRRRLRRGLGDCHGFGRFADDPRLGLDVPRGPGAMVTRARRVLPHNSARRKP